MIACRQLTGLVFLLGVSTQALAQAAPSAFTTGYRYDSLRRLVGEISPSPTPATPTVGTFVATRYTYDVGGRLIMKEQGPLSVWQAETIAPASWSGFGVTATSVYTYDVAGNKVEERVSGAAGELRSITQTTYDFNNNPLCVAVRMNMGAVPTPGGNACNLGTQGSDGPDRIVKNIYDAAGQLTQIRKAFATPLEQAYATYTYTDNGRQKFVTDANSNKARFCYDGFDQQSRWIFPSKTTAGSTTGANDSDTTCAVSGSSDYEEYGYDANGNRTTLRRRDGVTLITYGYDALNRVNSKSGSGSTLPAISYSYDLLGRMLAALFTSSGL
ncbi:MAG: hypothetical protein U1D69_09230, partial [Polynucleobacter sp.]|nr:hypothetical protein [Polynucleobacter sp.]